ncbi:MULTISPECIES: hypothetical protein [Serratia]|uniref:hypothetical protein n=1 Tax=Serratia TaxID=613 RepID=UPI0009006F6A|nr:hypothetical protein [Serratia marcescens]MBI6149253.1 hypothetical protein [Serratia marcescens]HEJ6938524.1 hypothetical protein [Serratia marcescens]HEJ7846219.1 hypothetical protein [Serratia marcescens]
MKLSDIVAVSGLLLTLVTFLFNLAWPKINDSLNQDESISGDRAKKRCRSRINKTLWGTVVPIFIAFFILFYINLPAAVKIILSSTLSLWDFNIEDTLYVMVEYALLAFVIFNAYLIVRFIIKSNKFK